MNNSFKLEINHTFMILVDIEYDTVYCSLYRIRDYEYDCINKTSFDKWSKNVIRCIHRAYEIFDEFTALTDEEN